MHEIEPRLEKAFKAVQPDMSVEEAAKIMVANKLEILVVQDPESRKIMGIVGHPQMTLAVAKEITKANLAQIMTTEGYGVLSNCDHILRFDTFGLGSRNQCAIITDPEMKIVIGFITKEKFQKIFPDGE